MSFTLQEVYPCVFDVTAVEGVSDSGRLEPLVKQYMQESIQQQRPAEGISVACHMLRNAAAQ